MSKKEGEVHFWAQINQKALIRKGNKIFLVQYPDSDPKAGGMWDMPGGRLNDGEDVVAGLKREVFEETGLEIVVGRPLTTGTFINLAGKPNFFVIYEASLVDESKTPVVEEGEIGATKWWNETEVLTLPILYPQYQEALRRILV